MGPGIHIIKFAQAPRGARYMASLPAGGPVFEVPLLSDRLLAVL